MSVFTDPNLAAIGSIAITVALPVLLAWVSLVPQLKKLRIETQQAAKTESDRRDVERTKIDTEQRLANVREHQELYGVLNREMTSLRDRINTLETDLTKSRKELIEAILASASAERDASEAKRATLDCKQNEAILIAQINDLRVDIAKIKKS